MVVPRHVGTTISHQHVADLPALLQPGDLVVLNDTKVMPVRLSGRKRPGGGRVEMVLMTELGNHTWEVLLRGRVRPGQLIELAPDVTATVVQADASRTVIRLAHTRPLSQVLQEIGQMPLPPYIKRSPTEADRQWYQTVFARAEGSIAAPTAGLHFTHELLAALRERRIGITTVTLHVGPATFRPVRTSRIEEHVMPPEQFELPSETAAMVMETRARGGRIVAVGTTVVRALETAARGNSVLQPVKGEADLFIRPGYRFRLVDAMLTNFHLPRTTLLMLVSAFAGLERIREAYQEAIRQRYRFYSYGDAMLIL